MRDVPEAPREQVLAGVSHGLAEPPVDAEIAAVEVLVGDADGRVLERPAEPRLALAERPLDPAPLADLALQLTLARDRKHPGQRRHQRGDGGDRNDGRGELDQARQAVHGRVEHHHLHQVGEAAEDDERRQEPGDPGEGQVPATANVAGQHQRDRDVRQPNQQVGRVVQDDEAGRPVAALDPGHEPGGVEQPREEFHRTPPIDRSASPRRDAPGPGRADRFLRLPNSHPTPSAHQGEGKMGASRGEAPSARLAKDRDPE